MKKILIITILIVFSQNIFAYGPSGCGFGSMLIGGDNTMWKQIIAITFNHSFGSQSFGITSGTSDCGGGGTSPTTEQFIEANRVSLGNDIARGQGETLMGLRELMGCEKDAEFGSQLQKNFKQIFPTHDVAAQSISKSIRAIIGDCSSARVLTARK